jgi:RNA polymerase primary sigma factor
MAQKDGRVAGDLDGSFSRMGSHRLLTRREEQQLFRRLEEGDTRARESIICHNLRLVMSVARGYLGRGLDFEDLFQEGVLGLFHATTKFDWRRGNKFSTYAIPWVRQSIGRAIDNGVSTIRIPIHVRAEERRLRRLEADDPKASDEVLALRLGTCVERIGQLRALTRVSASLDQPVKEPDGVTLGEILPDARPGAYEEVQEASECAELSRALVGLDPQEREVLRLRYGGGRSDLSHVAKQLGLSRARVRAIEHSATEALRSDVYGKNGTLR